MVAILARREVEVSAIEATAFALGIHEDTGSLGYAGTTVRDAEALAWCMRRGASEEMVARVPAHAARRARARAARRTRRGPRAARGGRLRGARGRAPVAVHRGRHQPRAQDRRPDRLPRARLPRRDGRPGLLRGPDAGGRARCLGGRGGPGRRRSFAGGIGHLPGLPRGRACRRARGPSERRAPRSDRGRDHVAAGPLRLPGRHCRACDGPVPAPPPERDARQRAQSAGGRRHA